MVRDGRHAAEKMFVGGPKSDLHGYVPTQPGNHASLAFFKSNRRQFG
jgi:hypothetical protein